MVDLGCYLLGAAKLAIVVASLAIAACCLRRRLLPDWRGPVARLVEIIVAVALLTWISEILGTLTIFYGWTVVAAAALLAALSLLLTNRTSTSSSGADPSPVGGVVGGDPRGAEARSAEHRGGAHHDRTRGQWAMSLVVLGIVCIVVAHWAITTKSALDRGIFNFDSLWYHMPFAAEMAQSHSLTGMHYVDTVFTNWFYPQNSELLHGVGIALTERDTLSLFLNYGWLAVAFLAAWCIGAPYGRGGLCMAAAAILLEAHILVVREPGAAKNDLMAAALLLAAVAILINAWKTRNPPATPVDAPKTRLYEGKSARQPVLLLGWPVAAAGLAVGLAAGTKVTALAMAVALSVAVIVLAPRGRRWAAAGWWFVPVLLGGGFWYLRNLIVAGNPLPAVESLGPISLPHPERLQIGRPDFSIVHYAADTGIWREYFVPGLHSGFGGLWPLVIGAAIVAALAALLRGRSSIVRTAGAVVLFGFLAYLFTPLSAAGADGAPEAFGINIRYIYGALLMGLVLVPMPRVFDDRRRQWCLLGALLVVLLLTDRADAVIRDPDRLFALLIVVLAVLIPAALLLAWRRGVGRGIVIAGSAALLLAVVAIGYPVQRHYLEQRFANQVADESIPGMHLDSAYRWARGIEDSRIGLAGTSAAFAQYGFFGTDLSNEVRYLGVKGPHGAYNAIPTCSAFRAAVNDADLDYLVTAPFLNFLHPDRPIGSPEAHWLRGESAVAPVLRSGPVTVWKVRGELDPAGCAAANEPLRDVPDTRAG